ncbi:hypothetical protein [Nocardia cerradoensis]|uniref:hypothetical protein n=1 Tax=Nocardia cerradoensis TaxID=85688 RepID=UPI00117F0ED0|nr:hypothetical protein [Nocardia cerradoensis]NKY47738.1 hypothetical protein [Nocardia cerradoensis]
MFDGRRISVTSIANVSDECDELEFRKEGTTSPIVIVGEQDESRGDLHVSIHGQADVAFVRFAIAVAEEYFSE